MNWTKELSRKGTIIGGGREATAERKTPNWRTELATRANGGDFRHSRNASPTKLARYRDTEDSTWFFWGLRGE